MGTWDVSKPGVGESTLELMTIVIVVLAPDLWSLLVLH